MNSHMLNSFRCSGRGMAELPRTVVLLLDPVLEPMVPLPHVLGGVGSLMAPVGGLEPAGGELLLVWQLRQSTLLPRGWLAVLRVRTSRHKNIYYILSLTTRALLSTIKRTRTF